jgi:bifunctional ADP-heptose synthase (sugar kinase/adenylyltransferase)
MAAIAAGLCAGATLEEAALLGNLAAAVTIRQLGTTGAAAPEQMMEQWRAAQA